MWRMPSAVTIASLTTSCSFAPTPADLATLATSFLAIWVAAALPASWLFAWGAESAAIAFPAIVVPTTAATAAPATQHRVERFMKAPSDVRSRQFAGSAAPGELVWPRSCPDHKLVGSDHQMKRGGPLRRCFRGIGLSAPVLTRKPTLGVNRIPQCDAA